jgi:SAM-dependent methyltransferase
MEIMLQKRKIVLQKVAKILGLSYVEVLEHIAEVNFYKNLWYATQKADYNSNWFCVQTTSDYFDFTSVAIDDCFDLLHQHFDFDYLKRTSAIDLGAGCGLSTQKLALYLPKVVYNNFSARQLAVALSLGLKQKIIAADCCDIRQHFDIIFAFEFFEHFQKPLKAFELIVKNIKPKMIFMQNSFGAFGYGHFKEYEINGKIYSNKTAGAAFNEALKKLGYTLIKKHRVVLAYAKK